MIIQKWLTFWGHPADDNDFVTECYSNSWSIFWLITNCTESMCLSKRHRHIFHQHRQIVILFLSAVFVTWRKISRLTPIFASLNVQASEMWFGGKWNLNNYHGEHRIAMHNSHNFQAEKSMDRTRVEEKQSPEVVNRGTLLEKRYAGRNRTGIISNVMGTVNWNDPLNWGNGWICACPKPSVT